MQLLKQMLPSAALAVAVTAALLFVFARWWKSAGHFAGALAIGGGYLAGHVLAAGWSPFPPRHATQWLFWFAVIGVIAAAVDDLVRPKRRARIVTWAIVSAIACRLILQPKFTYAWSAAEGWLWILAITVGLAVLACCLDLVERGPFGSATLFSVATLLSGGACLALMLSASLLLGQLAVVLMAIAATCFLISVVRPALFLDRSGAAAPLSLVFAGLLLSGFFYAELPAASALLLALAPNIALLPVSREGHSNSRVLMCRLALVAIPVVIAVVLAFHASPPLDY
jgi:hypothetical protein